MNPRSKPSFRLLLLLLGLLLVVDLSPWGARAGLSAEAPAPGSPYRDLRIDLGAADKSFTFIVYGDLRFTDPKDTWDTDPVRRVALVDRIAQERPDLLIITGDLVLKGDRFSDWDVFDQQTRPWREAGLRVFPTLGNHDLTGALDLALENYFRRFPALNGKRWYSLRYGNCYFLMVDSDSETGPGSAQRDWMAWEFSHLPRGTDYVFVVAHHPSYTQSTYAEGAGHAARGSEQRLGKFLEERQKTLNAQIFEFSGHVHNYERYQIGGVMYIVTAGGGAVPYAVTRGKNDFYREAGPTYHFCRFTISGHHLKFEMTKLVGEGRGARWEVKDSFEMR